MSRLSPLRIHSRECPIAFLPLSSPTHAFSVARSVAGPGSPTHSFFSFPPPPNLLPPLLALSRGPPRTAALPRLPSSFHFFFCPFWFGCSWGGGLFFVSADIPPRFPGPKHLCSSSGSTCFFFFLFLPLYFHNFSSLSLRLVPFRFPGWKWKCVRSPSFLMLTPSTLVVELFH